MDKIVMMIAKELGRLEVIQPLAEKQQTHTEPGDMLGSASLRSLASTPWLPLAPGCGYVDNSPLRSELPTYPQPLLLRPPKQKAGGSTLAMRECSNFDNSVEGAILNLKKSYPPYCFTRSYGPTHPLGCILPNGHF